MLKSLKDIVFRLYYQLNKNKFGHITPSTRLLRAKVYNKKNLYMGENTNLDAKAVIMNSRARFVMKKNSGAAIGLTVITGNHLRLKGLLFKSITNQIKDRSLNGRSLDKDVVVEEDVWIGANVTLLSGTHIGRGATVGAASVVRSNVPPYAIVVGNPAKVVGFNFTPEEIIEHEKSLYPQEERITADVLDKNYKKYFLDRIAEIKNILKL